MTDSVRFDRRLLWAVLASLALHLWLASVFPSGTATEDPVAALSFARVAPITIERSTPTPPRRIARLTHAALLPAPAPRVRRPHVLPELHAYVRAARPQAATRSVAVAAPTAAPTAAPPTPAPITQHEQTAGGYMPFGAQEDTPVLDPRVLQALRALDVHATLTIVVGEDGKTQSVAFAPPLDPQTESAIETALARANWDPAYCGGGIPCAKTTTIKL